MKNEAIQSNKNPYKKEDIEIANMVRYDVNCKILDDWDTIWKDITKDIKRYDFVKLAGKSAFQRQFKEDIVEKQQMQALENEFTPLSHSSIVRIFAPIYQDKALQENTLLNLLLFLGYESIEDYQLKNGNRFSDDYFTKIILPLKKQGFQEAEIETEQHSIVEFNNEHLNDKNEIDLADDSNTVKELIGWNSATIKKGKLKKMHLYSMLLFIMVVTLSLIGKYHFNMEAHGTIKIDTIERNVENGLPCSVDVSFKTKNCTDDSIQIDFGEFQHERPLKTFSRRMGKASFYYTKPTCTKIKLIYQGKVLSDVPLILESKDWNGWYSYFASNGREYLKYQSKLFTGNDIYRDHCLHIKQKDIVKTVHSEDNWTKFRNVKDFGIYANDCEIVYRVRNSLESGGIADYDVCLSFYTSTGQKIEADFENKGAHYWAGIKINGMEYSSKTGKPVPDLAQNFSDWRLVGLSVFKGKLNISIDGILLYTYPCSNLVGNINAIEIAFRGSGLCSYVGLKKKSRPNYVYESKF